MSTVELDAQQGPGAPRGAAKAAPRGRRLGLGDPIFRGLATICGITVAVAMFGLAIVLVYDSWPAISGLGTKVITTVAWSPTEHKYGALAALAGTALSTFVAMVIAVPLALVIALLLVELVHPAVSRVVGTAIEMLAAIPSIIFGMVGIFVIVPWVQDHLVPWLTSGPLGSVPGIKPGSQFQGGGMSIFTAGVVLAFMVLPFITAVSRDVLKMVPQVTKEAGYGMGSTTWEVMRNISLRYANSGIVGAVFIGLGRALGETMAVTMVIGNRPEISASLFAPGYTLASVIANEFTEATSDLYLNALFELGLVLLAVTILVNIAAQVMLKSITGGGTGKVH